MRRYLAGLCPEITGRGAEQYVSVAGQIRTGLEVEDAALKVATSVNKVVKAGDRVVIATDDAFWVSVFLLAVWNARAEPVFASSLTARDILQVARPALILTTDELEERDVLELSKYGRKLLSYDDSMFFADDKSFGFAAIKEPLIYLDDPEFEPVITQMTSGSTGKPQAITRSLKGLLREVKTLSLLYPSSVTSDPKVVMCATVPILHAYGLCFRYLLSLYLGIAVMRTQAGWEEQLGPDISGAFTKVWLVTSPAFLRRLGQGPANFDCVFMQTAGGRLGATTAARALDYFKDPEFLEILGSTETGVMAWRMASRKEDDSLWTFLEPESLRALDEVGDKTLTLKTQGMGLLSSGSSYIEPWLAREFTVAQGGPGNYFVTGDLVELRGDGLHFKLIGRQSRVIKVEDNRFSLDETEEQLMSSGLMLACAMTEYDNHGRTSLQAAVVLNGAGETRLLELGRSKFILELRKKLSGLMPALAIPRRFIFCEQLPLSATGKILYKEVKGMFEHAFSGS